MQRFKFNSAQVTTEQITKCGLYEAICTGPITPQAGQVLRGEMLKAVRQSTAYVLRLDRALFVMSDEPDLSDDSYLIDSPIGAMIVRADQYEFCLDYALRVSKFGIVRTVWLESNARLAYQWALRRSDLRNAELQR